MNVVKEENNLNSSLMIFEKIEKTPFTIYGNEEEGYILLMGRHRLTEEKMTKENILKDAKRMDWDRIMQVCYTVTESIIIENNNLKKQK